MKTKLLPLVLVSLHLNVFACGPVAEDYVAHEWGTFTSVQGADGIQIEWNPLATTELPSFVYDRNRPGGARAQGLVTLSSKSTFVTLQRMETPVIYFYSTKERKVDVTVKFPEGIITEWYPQVAQLSPTNSRDMELFQQHGVRWSGVQILPQALNQELAQRLPLDKAGSHYYAARDTEADFLRVSPAEKSASEQEHEKFLFYRGVGSFRAPLQVTLGGNEDFLNVLNTGKEDLTHLFVLNVRKAAGQTSLAGKYIYIDRLAAGENRMVKLEPQKDTQPLSELCPQIMQRMQESLTATGLYDRESGAMVQTWQDSWFGEEGLRVLYILPRKWTDQTLPLTLNPVPKSLVRVMVGRAEVITPSMEWQFLKQIVKFGESDEAARQRVVAETRSLGLGRFAEPTVRRILGRTPSREFSQQAWSLLQATKAPAGPKGFAVK